MSVEENETEQYLDETIKNKYNKSPYRIPLRNRSGVVVEYALVSAGDYERVNAYRWHLVSGGYANSTIDGVNIRMHHFVYKKPQHGYVIDHINQDKLNNQLSNLREITYSANRNNISKTDTETSSKYKGVNLHKQSSRFRARYDDIMLYYGPDEKQAAIMYDIYTFQQFGEHANNNRLISYEDAMKYEFPAKEKKERELPDNISMFKNKYYRVKRFFREKRHTEYFKTLEEAQKRLDEINAEIREILDREEREYLATPIRRNRDGIAFIPYKEQEILVSDVDWHTFNREPWYIDKNTGYVYNNDQQTMHRIVRPCDDLKKVVHHINGNRLDNRRENLEVTSASANAHQRSTKSRNSSSEYFGVVYHKPTKKWMARMKKDGVSYYLGLYTDEKDAAKAYNVKALELYGPSANLNLM